MQCARCDRPLPDAGTPCICTLVGTGLPPEATLPPLAASTIATISDTAIAPFADATLTISDAGVATIAPRDLVTIAPPEIERHIDRRIERHDVDLADAVTIVPGEHPADVQWFEDEGPLKVGQAFGSRYRIIRLLGIGGMGVVYQAWDEELSVAVALKMIRTPEGPLGRSSELERQFKHELLLARQVTHKNVVRIHDLGEMDGIKYLTMPYIKGRDLAEILRREGRLPIERTMRLARQIADGLAAAHEAGIVHRDLKPANIMVSGEGDTLQALIMDFGISAPASQVERGEITGTLEYMAPEQGAGGAVDARADVYAYGLIVYEMLCGNREPAGRSLAERLDAMRRRSAEGVPAIRTVNPDVPLPLADFVMKCLSIDPALRLQSGQEVAAALALLDDAGEVKPVPPRFGAPLIAASIVTVVALVGGTWWLTRTPPVPPAHAPVSVLIADVQNRTGDTAFDRSLEPTVKMSLEGASFVTAFDRTQFRTLGVAPPAMLDAPAAREVAIKQGLGVVISGTLEPYGSGYSLSMTASQAVTGNVIGSADARASNKEGVLAAATKVGAALRRALGDSSSDTNQRFAMETLSATSLDVVREYVAAMEAVSNSRFDEARMRFSKAVELDPNFGLAYAGMAMMSWNLRQQQDAEKFVKEAVRHVDKMTDRERYRTRGLFYMITGDDQACVKEYTDLLTLYAADSTAHNNLALCSSHLRNWPRALDEMKRVVEILPKRALYRVNLGLYAAYGGDFAVAAREAAVARDLGSPLGWLPAAFAATGQQQMNDARASYQEFGKVAAGASYMASGLADIAAYEGRFKEAARLYQQGAESDLKAGGTDRAAAKIAGMAYAELSRGELRSAIRAAERALATSTASKIRFQAARLLIDAGAPATQVQPVIDALGAELLAEPQAYAKILEGNVAVKQGNARLAVQRLTEANTILDTWIGRFDLGRAYLQAGAFTQADSEFDRCVKRKGEAIALFLDEEPTFGYFPPVLYYQGRVREGLKSAGAADAYRAYVRIREAAGEDPLLADARGRASN